MLKRTEAHSLCTVKEAIFHCIWHYNLRILINCKLLKCQQILLIYPASRKLHPFRERKQQNRELHIHHACFCFFYFLIFYYFLQLLYIVRQYTMPSITQLHHVINSSAFSQL